MQTIKTAVVVVLLLAVCYGAIVALNAPDPKLPPELEQWAEQGELDLSMDPSEMVAMEIPKPSVSSLSIRPNDSTAPQTTLPKFDLNGAPVNTAPPLASAPPQLASNASNSLSLIPETEGPDGPMISLPSLSPPSSQGFSSTPSNLPAVPTETAPQSTNRNLPSPSGLLANTSTLPNVTAPPISSMPTSTGQQSSDTSIPGHLTSASSTDGQTTLPSSTSVPTGSSNQAPLAGSLSSSLGAATPPSLIAMNNPTKDNVGGTSSGSALSSTPAVSPTETTKLPTQPFRNAREQALKQAKDGKLKDALFTLSMFYDSVELTRDEHVDMLAILDALAGEVIYSRQHLFESPYRAVPGDTVESIAIKHSITRDLLARINGLDNSSVVLPGTELKIVRGPFRAAVDLTRGELTLFVGELYAGRFPISVGQDPAPREGTFEIVDKRVDRTYYGVGSNPIPANDPRNPYGGYWMNLGQEMCIHGTAEMATNELSKAGCISLAPIDAADVYAILAQGAKVRVHR